MYANILNAKFIIVQFSQLKVNMCGKQHCPKEVYSIQHKGCSHTWNASNKIGGIIKNKSRMTWVQQKIRWVE